MSQPVFFDVEDRLQKRNELDPLVSLKQLIDWENFRGTLNLLRKKERKSHAVRKAFDVVLMFKVLMLQHLYNLNEFRCPYLNIKTPEQVK